MKIPHLTIAEAKLIHDSLRGMWIPNQGYDEFMSAMKKLEAMSRTPEERPYSNRGSNDRG